MSHVPYSLLCPLSSSSTALPLSPQGSKLAKHKSALLDPPRAPAEAKAPPSKAGGPEAAPGAVAGGGVGGGGGAQPPPPPRPMGQGPNAEVGGSGVGMGMGSGGEEAMLGKMREMMGAAGVEEMMSQLQSMGASGVGEMMEKLLSQMPGIDPEMAQAFLRMVKEGEGRGSGGDRGEEA